MMYGLPDDGYLSILIRNRSGETLFESLRIKPPPDGAGVSLTTKIKICYVAFRSMFASKRLGKTGIDHTWEQIYFSRDGRPLFFVWRMYCIDHRLKYGIAPWVTGGEPS